MSSVTPSTTTPKAYGHAGPWWGFMRMARATNGMAYSGLPA